MPKALKFRAQRLGELAIGAFFALTLCASANGCLPSPLSAGGAQLPTAPVLQLPGVPRLVQVTATLFRSGQPSKEGFAALAQLGIGIVIDLRGSRESERRRVTALGMQYVAIPWHCPFPRDKTFARFLKLLRENPDKKVLVHCRLGDDRTGMMIASYRMAEQGWTAEQAAKEMRANGFTLAHHLICPGLACYENKFPQHLQTKPEFQDLRPPAH